jgi:translocation and assembly module TamB
LGQALDNNLANFDIKPELAISGKLTNPSMEGRMEVVSGEITYLNRNFVISKGLIDFINPYKIAPEIDIIAQSTVDQWDIEIQVKGIAGEELEYISSSKPHLEENQILSLILTGKLAEDFNSQEFLMNQLAAAALDKLNSNMEIELSESGVTLGEELSRRLYTEYSMGMEDGKMTQVASVIVKILDQLGVRGFAGSEGEAGGEVEFNVQIR